MNLSFKIMLYNFYLTAFVVLVLKPANKIRFGITPDIAAGLTAAQTSLTTNFTLYVDPNEYDSNVVNDTNTSYFNAFAITESIKKTIKGNPTLVFTSLERLILGIPVPPTRRTHVPVPDISPAVVCVFKAELLMRFIAFDPTSPFKKGKPKDVASIGVKIAVTDKGAIPEPKDYIVQVPEKNIEFELLFTSDQVGKTVYVICYYLNARNESGKDGMPISVGII